MTDRELSPLERVERGEFSRGHIAPGETPVKPRPARYRPCSEFLIIFGMDLPKLL